ncbi:MAG TPA: zinc dependent phospholipase C family protein [Candidatus Acidoferrales bacterium]|nr:zinc dependent phospholipase C family protein [Candidatus Acidoferrales bacterium]
MPHRRIWQLKIAARIALLFLMVSQTCGAYSVMSHEALIDSAWDPAIKPLLLKRFPDATPDQLKEAHSYAWGGAVIQDMGYYPFGSKLFSDLTHYVRSGDFVVALIRDSQNIDEYAFALGALAHYAADNEGHRMATNKAVPMLYPKLREKYGDVVVYDENPAAHLKTEFGFDVLQVAKGHYAPDDYRDHIGFQVSKEVLDRAFQETYCLKLDDIFTNYDLALGTYRHAVGSIIPKMTKVAWQTKKDEIMQSDPSMTRKRFLYHLSRSSYRKRYGKAYEQPTIGERILAFFIRILPKVGPLSALSFRMPTPATEKLFMASFNDALQNYQQLDQQVRATGHPDLINDNFDTGTVTGPGEYPLADKTYADLLDRLAKDKFAQVSPELRADILGYFINPNAPYAIKKNKKEWDKVVREVNDLKTADLSRRAKLMN